MSVCSGAGEDFSKVDGGNFLLIIVLVDLGVEETGFLGYLWLT
jgi:hypothetical protein